MFVSPAQHESPRPADAGRVEAGASFARALAGDWRGHGFSLVVWPSRPADRPCFLEMHRTTERLFVAAGGDAFAAEPSTLVFDQTVSDMGSGLRLAREAGMWFVHPASAGERQAGETLTLIATGSDGAVTVASGDLSRGGRSDMVIAPVNTAPFPSGDRAPEPGTRGRFAPYDFGDVSESASRSRTLSGAGASFEGLSPQAVLDDPTCLLRAALARQTVEGVMTASVADSSEVDLTAPMGQVAGDRGFLTTVWVERIRDGAAGFDQLQYVQATRAYFAPFGAGPTFAWPQVRVATLRRVASRTYPDVH